MKFIQQTNTRWKSEFGVRRQRFQPNTFGAGKKIGFN